MFWPFFLAFHGVPFLKAFFLLGGFFGFHGVPFRSTARKATNHGVRFLSLDWWSMGCPFLNALLSLGGQRAKLQIMGCPFLDYGCSIFLGIP